VPTFLSSSLAQATACAPGSSLLHASSHYVGKFLCLISRYFTCTAQTAQTVAKLNSSEWHQLSQHASCARPATAMPLTYMLPNYACNHAQHRIADTCSADVDARSRLALCCLCNAAYVMPLHAQQKAWCILHARQKHHLVDYQAAGRQSRVMHLAALCGLFVSDDTHCCC
jgi:hypothetical protein